jgi:hypothetical protein
MRYLLIFLMLFVLQSSTELSAKHKKRKKHHTKKVTQAHKPNPWIFDEGKNYVTCKWAGELGNQMFEAAAVLAYARDHNYEAVFPSFDTAAGGHENYYRVFYRLNVLPSGYDISFIDHNGTIETYVPILYEPGKNIRILGHNQNERYFVHHKEYIKEIFAPSPEILGDIANKYGDLEILFKEPTVGIHVRTFIRDGRNPEIVGFEGATWNYFIQAIEYFPEDYNFLVFSDHPKWTKQHFPRMNRKITFIAGNPPYIDLYFMSLCHHQVVSPGSTFSWWAGWLNRNTDKVVIVPHFWQAGYTGEDAFPPDWVRINAELIEGGQYGKK